MAEAATQQVFNRREVAQRMFAAEFNQSRFEEKESDDERSPTHVYTPLGARTNRVFVVGVLTEVEPAGEGGDLLRARVSDPTGLFTIYAGRYQPEAQQALANLEPPTYVAVVGKARTYEPEPGRVFASIRPETITQVEDSVRDHWVLETARLTRQRATAMRAALKENPPTAAGLEREGVAAHLAEGVMKSFEKYEGDVDPDYFDRLVKDAVGALARGETFSTVATQESSPPPPVAVAKAQVAAVAGGGSSEGPGEAVEAQVLEIVRSLAGEDDKGAQWDQIVTRGRSSNLSEDQVEEALNALMDKGTVYEPILGRLKLT